MIATRSEAPTDLIANRRSAVAAATLGLAAMLVQTRPVRAQDVKGCAPGAAEAAAFAVHDRYVAAANSDDPDAFSAVIAEDYIQHSGRSQSGLAAFIANSRAVRAIFPDWHLDVQDRIFGDGKLVARNIFTGTQRGKFRGFEPTGKVVTLKTIDIWRISAGKFVEHWDVVDFADVDKQLRGD